MKKLFALVLALLLVGSCAWAEEELQTTTLRLGRFSIDIPQHWYYSIYTHSNNLDKLDMFFYPITNWMEPSTGYINLRYFRIDDGADATIADFIDNHREREDFAVEPIVVTDIPAYYCTYRSGASEEKVSTYCLLVPYDDVAFELLYHRASAFDDENEAFFDSLIETVQINSEADDSVE